MRRCRLILLCSFLMLLCSCSVEKGNSDSDDYRQEIVAGILCYDGYEEQLVTQFNNSNKNYKIIIKDYSKYEDKYTQMILDISAGNAPDLIELTGMPVEEFAKLGVFEDLMPYFERDSVLKLEDYVAPVMEASKINEKLYCISPYFGISTMFMERAEDYDGDGWSIEEMISYVESKPKPVKLFELNKKTEILGALLFGNFSDYIDWNAGTCNFDSQQFKGLIKLADYGQDGLFPETSSKELIASGKQLFVAATNQTLTDLIACSRLFSDPCMIGYPCESKNGSSFFFNYRFAMSSDSDVKDGVWEFMKTVLSKETQYVSTVPFQGIMGIPTRQDCFDELMKALTTTEEYVDEYGYTIRPLNDSYSLPYMDTNIVITPFTEEERKLLMDLIDKTNRVFNYNPNLENIVREETEYYFNGEKNLEETIQVIQNRISRYVSERK